MLSPHIASAVLGQRRVRVRSSHRTLVTAQRSDTGPAGRCSCLTAAPGCPVGACPARSDAVDHLLRQRTCRACSQPFVICAACDRGHAYCSAACREAGRRRSVRAARARHQRSPEGRLDHRDRQRAYRARRRRVTDHTSPRPRPSGRLSLPDSAPVFRPASLRCVVCGRPIRLRNPLGGPGGYSRQSAVRRSTPRGVPDRC